MDEIDNAIVEFLQELEGADGEPVAQSPALIYRNLVEIRGVLDCAGNTISRHLKKLWQAGLLERLEEDSAHYVLTDLGRRYPDDLPDEERADLEQRLDSL
ncbi:transcriptional regulator [Halopiger xanaduensis]|nr:transcriptional regulator [Halopiger xanaduensis]